MTRYIDTKEVAKIIRKRLRATFSGVKFSVRIERFAGGSAVRINWTDGPSATMVKNITDQYASAGFDGMIDMAYTKDHWLLPDGSAVLAHSPGTTGSMGLHEPVENEKPHPDAELVHFCSGYVTTNRIMTEKLIKAKMKITAKKWGVDTSSLKIEPHNEYSSAWVRGANELYVENAQERFNQLMHRDSPDICIIDPSWKIGRSAAWA